MRNIHIDSPDLELSYKHAKFLAWDAARKDQMQDPTIMSWHDSRGMSPRFEGGNPDTWWEKYGEGNGGRLQITVDDKYTFIMMDARDFETLDDIPLRNLRDSEGRQYVCFKPLLGDSTVPTQEACSLLDEWTADQY